MLMDRAPSGLGERSGAPAKQDGTPLAPSSPFESDSVRSPCRGGTDATEREEHEP